MFWFTINWSVYISQSRIFLISYVSCSEIKARTNKKYNTHKKLILILINGSLRRIRIPSRNVRNLNTKNLSAKLIISTHYDFTKSPLVKVRFYLTESHCSISMTETTVFFSCMNFIKRVSHTNKTKM